ncbi:hypothetical protein VTK26DRAFT_4596 [Humicola hyalothermophila]
MRLDHQHSRDVNINVRDGESREGVCLPEISPIYPLPGNVLLRSAPDIQGLTTPEAFCSEGFGTVFTLHTEDYDAPSINVNHSGSGKLWVVIPREEHEKLVDTLDRDGLAKRPGDCHQYVRHESLFLHPRYLDENRILYRCFVQAPGVAVLVFPGAAHYGFNLGTNVAEAVNYVPEGWLPPDLKKCACNREQMPITRRMFLAPQTTRSTLPAGADSRHKRQGDTSPAPGGRTKRSRVDHDAPAEPAAAVSTQRADEEDPDPRQTLVPELVDGTTGAESIRRFMGMVKTWQRRLIRYGSPL